RAGVAQATGSARDFLVRMTERADVSEGASPPEAEPVVLVQFGRGGYEEVSRADLVEESAQAIDRAMDTIKGMGERVSATVESLVSRPAEVEVAFGVVLDAQAGALIARVGARASMGVTREGVLRAGA